MAGVLLYGAPAPGLVEVPRGAVQVSPIILGSLDIAAMADASADQAFVLAPGGTIERDYVLAQALRVVKPGEPLTVFAPKAKGGARLKKVLEAFGCAVSEDARKHHRFCHTLRPQAPQGIAEAIAAGSPVLLPDLGLWSQPGVFSWDRIDPGSARMLALLPKLAGRGADLGCGIGVLAGQILASPAVTELTCVDNDRRAAACAEHNLNDPRARVIWGDARQRDDEINGLDFVVMNPPFHDGGSEDRALGVAFIQSAAQMLHRDGVCWIVANRHLPYEAPLAAAFTEVAVRADAGGYKIFEARK
jgi:16S rRNA (guanine1207-N2)-methyltransferase